MGSRQDENGLRVFGKGSDLSAFRRLGENRALLALEFGKAEFQIPV